MSETENNSGQLDGSDLDIVPPRRKLLLGAAGALAAVAGAGIAWWRTSSPGGGGQEPAPEGFWDMQWDAPHGDPVRLQAFRGKPLLINFWATWCAPCVEEMPAINDVFLKNRANGWQVLGLAVDKPSSVAAFLQKMSIAYPIGMAGANGTEWAARLGNPSGALPYSVLLGSEGLILQRRLGKLSHSDLDAWARLK